MSEADFDYAALQKGLKDLKPVTIPVDTNSNSDAIIHILNRLSLIERAVGSIFKPTLSEEAIGSRSLADQEATDKFGFVSTYLTETGEKRIEDLTRDELLQCIRDMSVELRMYRPKWKGC